MHPVHDAGRRRCRAEAILRSHGRRDGVLFVHGARIHKSTNFRIALAIVHGTETDSLIISDAKRAIRNYIKGWISAGAARALNAKARDFQDGTLSTKTLKWFPAHKGELNRQKPEIPDNLNERAHRVARRLTHAWGFRGDPVTGERSYMTTAIQDNKDLMVTYHEILSHFRKQRQTYPHPHQQLDSLKPQTYDACKRTRLRILPTYTGFIRIYIHHQPVLGAGTPRLT
ncbi:hypothetical protein HPB50_009189 [Hyalomma asiaticum]|uniref:Uncharacterized protein n=1 Tax=Hyalomma asiaticum TaxID=266040 RepID=A0ACB7SFN4_HYAAI|nr:hypothetical protein HPB50_009189 [Hyalomma asiaticum]